MKSILWIIEHETQWTAMVQSSTLLKNLDAGFDNHDVS